jgi:4-oxalocrotonate tautomerase
MSPDDHRQVTSRAREDRADRTARSESHLTKEPIMPLIQVKLIENVFTPDQKQEMIHKLTETMIGIEGESMRSVTSVIVEEVRSGDWGIGGQALTTQDVKDLQGSGA